MTQAAWIEAALTSRKGTPRDPTAWLIFVGRNVAIDAVEPLQARLSGYFHFHGAKGAYLHQLGPDEEAREAFQRAIALAGSAAEATHIRMQLDQLAKE